MAPEPLDDATRARMRRQKRRDTNLEMQVRRRLYAAGRRYRVDFRPEKSLRCRADIVFLRAKVAVFIDGCFWHGCPIHATQPKNNSTWWRAKLDANMDRDRRHSAALTALGWTVLRFWEHEDPTVIATKIQDLLR